LGSLKAILISKKEREARKKKNKEQTNL